MVLVAYIAILHIFDGTLINHDIYASAGTASDRSQSITSQKAKLSRQVTDQQVKLTAILARKEFSQSSFQELAQAHHCRLVQLETKNTPKERGDIYEVTYAGTIENSLDLLNSLESGYVTIIREAVMTAEDASGALVRLKLTLVLRGHDH